MDEHNDIGSYSAEEKQSLLRIARNTLTATTQEQPAPPIELALLSPALQAERACFVTLRDRRSADLRGCTGTLAARNPLALEVSLATEQTAFRDPRFPPVEHAEVDNLHIEISILTPMQPLTYTDANDLVHRLRPGIDGVTLQHGYHRATFLPQVWERVNVPETFLNMLSRKMGLKPSAWREHHMDVFTYQTIIIEED